MSALEKDLLVDVRGFAPTRTWWEQHSSLALAMLIWQQGSVPASSVAAPASDLRGPLPKELDTVWWIIDRRLAPDPDVVTNVKVEELLVLIDRLEHCQPAFEHVYTEAIAKAVRELEEHGLVVRWGD